MTTGIQVVSYSSFEQRCELERAEWMLATLISVFRGARKRIERLGQWILDVATSDSEDSHAPWSVRAVVGSKSGFWC